MVSIITGTSRGIGKFLAEYLLSLGHNVIGCSRSKQSLFHEKYDHYLLDISNELLVTKLFKSVRKKHRRLDVIINNAGIASMNHSILTKTETVSKIYKTNFIGTFIFCREAAKLMQTRKFGRIINFSTVAVPLNLEGEAVYASSKAAVVSFTKILSKELGSFGITVNSIGPTPIKTDLIKSVPSKKLDKIIKAQSIQRYGTYDDIANVINFFISKKSGFITGQNIYLGGI